MTASDLPMVLCLSMIGVALAISLPLTRICRGAAHRLGQVDAPGQRKNHDRPIPVTGGVAIFWAVIGPMLVGLAGAWAFERSRHWGLSDSLEEHLPHVVRQTRLAVTLIGSLVALHVMGLIDDRKGLGPFGKLLIQIGAAGVLAWVFEVRALDALGPMASIALTVLWFVTITNAFNFLDNMNGLSAGVAAICAAILLVIALMGAQWFVAALLALLIGALLGFLRYNFPNATIFMGDGGSLVVGFVLAFCSLRLTYVQLDPGHVAEGSWWAVFTPLVVLAIPLYDITTVSVIRLAQGRSPFVGDTQHFSHRLVRKGLSKPMAVVVIWACTLATGIGGILLGRVPGWAAALVVVQTLAILLVLLLLERTGQAASDG